MARYEEETWGEAYDAADEISSDPEVIAEIIAVGASQKNRSSEDRVPLSYLSRVAYACGMVDGDTTLDEIIENLKLRGLIDPKRELTYDQRTSLSTHLANHTRIERVYSHKGKVARFRATG